MVRRAGWVAGALMLSVGLTACTEAEAPPRPAPEPTSASPTEEPEPLTVGVYGHPEELRAWESIVSSFHGPTAPEVELVTWRNHDQAIRGVLDGEAPDVFMTSRRDLGKLTERDLTTPVGLRLDERGVDFGDRFSRDALDAFAVDDDLQCMPWSISPMVMYYNTDLVDFERMERRGLNVPGNPERWSMEEFTAAARFASRRPAATGVHIEPTLEGLAPFIYSGGGQLYDDAIEPTSLAFSEESTREALEETLAVLRDPTLTLSERQLRRATALEWFKHGRLAMIAGFRDLVPELRAVPELSFDVISMPVIDSRSTVGEIEGLCIAASSDNVNDAADFLAHAVSDEQMEKVTRTGYLVPANTSVAGSEIFLAEGRQPLHGGVFTDAIRGMAIPPVFDDIAALEEAVHPLLEDLLTHPGMIDLEEAGRRIDQVSQTVLGPEESESPSEDGSEEDSGEGSEEGSEEGSGG